MKKALTLLVTMSVIFGMTGLISAITGNVTVSVTDSDSQGLVGVTVTVGLSKVTVNGQEQTGDTSVQVQTGEDGTITFHVGEEDVTFSVSVQQNVTVGSSSYTFTDNSVEVTSQKSVTFQADVPADPAPDPNPDPDPDPDPDPEKPDPKPPVSDDDDEGEDSPFSGGGSGSGSGSWTNGGSASTSPVTSNEASSIAAESVSQAVSQTVASGTSSAEAAVSLTNVSTAAPEVFKAVVAAANAASAEKGVSITPVVHADTRNGNVVEARLYIDPVKAAELISGINLSVNVNDTATSNYLGGYFANSIKTIGFAQTGSFGMEIGVAARVDLTGMNLSNLKFYVYDAAANTLVPLANMQYAFDANGYIHFSTSYGGTLVISEGALTAK